MTKPRAKTTRWWVESLCFLAMCGGFLLWQGKHWNDLSEVKAIAVMALSEVIRSRFKVSE